MPIVSIVFGVLLGALSAWAYSTSDLEGPRKLTALIPAGFGLMLIVCGLLAMKERLLKHAMHAAAVVGVFGFVLGGVMGWPKLITLLQGGEVQRPNAVIGQSILGGLCMVFVGLCVNSFIQARKRRAAREAAGQPTP